MKHGGFIVLMLLLSSSALASKYTNCIKYAYSFGWWREYKAAYLGLGQVTKKNNSSAVSSQGTTERSTASVDPGVSTGFSVSKVQSWSSWGKCSFLELISMLEHREKYIVQNFIEIKKQMALGKGQHLEVLTYFSGCGKQAVGPMAKTLQGNFEAFAYLPKTDAKKFGKTIDNLINLEGTLKENCFPREVI